MARKKKEIPAALGVAGILVYCQVLIGIPHQSDKLLLVPEIAYTNHDGTRRIGQTIRAIHPVLIISIITT